MATGVETRKQKDGTVTYRASVWSVKDNKRIRRSFPSMAAAKAWRAEAQTAVRHGRMRAPTTTTVREVAGELTAGMRSGMIRNRSGDVYKPSAIRGYQEALDLRILPAIGAKRVSDVHRRDVQRILDAMLAAGSNPSTIRNTANAARVVFRHAIETELVHVNPCANLKLPAVRGRRDRIATPDEAAKLLSALEDDDRAIWATAFYAGLRRAELMALDWEHVDLAANAINVARSWDRVEGFIEPKSAAGTRRVPIPAVLREHLISARLRRGGRGLAFGRTEASPFDYDALMRRSAKRWKAAELQGIGLHDARHTYASLMIAAGVNIKALSTFMGHASITVTLDRYGHLMPGSETEAAGMLDTYLAKAAGAEGQSAGQ